LDIPESGGLGLAKLIEMTLLFVGENEPWTCGCSRHGLSIARNKNIYGYVLAERYIHEHEDKRDKIDIGCQQYERYKIRITEGKRVTLLSIPFDKVDRFKGAVRLGRHSGHKFLPYEVALSFAGEDRPYVRRVAEALRRSHIRVFYDEYEQASLWGKDLYDHLDEVYRKKARFCLLFVSKHYRSKVWTSHERQSAQARAFKERKSYILPVRLDGTDIPGIRSTVAYIDGRTTRPRELASLVQKKLFELE